MYVSMNPNGETGKAIHISQNDTNREVEFIPYDQNGLVKTTSDETVAHINSIKGNTVSFNQLVQNGNFADTSNWQNGNCTFTVSNNVATITALAQYGGLTNSTPIKLNNTHKYFLTIGLKATTNNTPIVAVVGGAGSGSVQLTSQATTSWAKYSGIFQPVNTTNNGSLQVYDVRSTGWDSIFVQNYMFIDLTLMGIDNLTTTAEVEEWLSSHIGNLPYFDYTQGTLIPFTGTGLKTENADQTESNTLSLPTLTYFPTGMKSAGSVYDELSDKAYTRIGSVDLGSLTWTYFSGSGIMQSDIVADAKLQTTSDAVGNAVCSIYQNVSRNVLWARTQDKMIEINPSNTSEAGKIWVYDTSYTNANTFKQAMADQNVKLYYELATPAETDISLDLTYPVWNGGTEQILPVNGSTPSTAPIKANITYLDRTEDTEFLYKQTIFDFIPKAWSFVCKNIESALTNVDGILKGTIPTTMTSESGKFPLKVKMTDEDGDVFSEKLDLFVERKP